MKAEPGLTQMEPQWRDLVLASEISAFLHDLGKIRPEFAEEYLEEPSAIGPHDPSKKPDREPSRKTWENQARKVHMRSAHGAILEQGRPYPPDTECQWLGSILDHLDWASVLRVPDEWLLEADGCREPRIQATGLGQPLREHHANTGLEHFTLLGTLYFFASDVRDSSLDKSGEVKGSGPQFRDSAFIADAFGNETQPYGAGELRKVWNEAEVVIQQTLLDDKKSPWTNVIDTRNQLISRMRPLFERALGVTIRPCNDVTLWHHAISTASLHKAAVAEGVLLKDFGRLQESEGEFCGTVFRKMGLVRYRLLGIRWDWVRLAASALQPVTYINLARRREEALERIRQRFEVAYPIGNVVYSDDDGVILAVPGFYHGDEAEQLKLAEELFEKLVLGPVQTALDHCLEPLGAGCEVRLAWTLPRLYLTDFAQVMSPRASAGQRVRVLQVREAELAGMWEKGNAICPCCGIRPGTPFESPLVEAGLGGALKGYCTTCTELAEIGLEGSGRQSAQLDRFRDAERLLGFRPKTFNIQKIRHQRSRDDNAEANPRLALLSVKTDTSHIASGAVLATQVARPLQDIRLVSGFNGLKDPNDLVEHLREVLGKLRESQELGNTEPYKKLLGDGHWLDKSDGRIVGKTRTETALALLDEFFLREHVPEELIRNDFDVADRLAMFAMRRHASPGRLSRTWDLLNQTWQELAGDIGSLCSGYIAPLSLDAGGFRLVLAASDLHAVLPHVSSSLRHKMCRLQGRIPLHVSVAVFREKFPLYLALDATRRMEKYLAKPVSETWKLQSKETMPDGNELVLHWNTGQRGGLVRWNVPLKSGDPKKDDLWYPYVICTSPGREGPNRLVHMTQLEVGDDVSVNPMTFDFEVLDTSVRRYQIRYDETGHRPHFILGAPGRRPYLLEDVDDLLSLANDTGWTSSQSKGVMGQLVQAYEKWVRFAPRELRGAGREAWLQHAHAVLRHSLPGERRQDVLNRATRRLEDGLLFDAFDWHGFVEKGKYKNQTPKGRPGPVEQSHA